MSFDNVNINVSGPVQPTSTYKTKVLKGNHSFASQVTEPNIKYVIKHDFDLEGESVTISEGCLLEFDGGAISNGTLVGQNTILIYNQPLNDILTATLEGTWRHESGVKADEEDITDINGELKFKDKAYAPANYSGLGRKILRKNIVDGVNTLTQSMINQPNTIYVIQYDFTLGEDITVPVNCVLEFDSGSLRNGTLISNDVTINALQNKIFENIHFVGDCVYSQFQIDWFVGNKNTSIVLDGNQKDSTLEIQAAFNSGVCNFFFANKYFYYISNEISMPSYITIDGVHQSKSTGRSSLYQTPCLYTDKEINILVINAARGVNNSKTAHHLYINNLYIYRASPFTEIDRKENYAAIRINCDNAFIWGGELNAYIFSVDRQLPTSTNNPATAWFMGYTGIKVSVTNGQYLTMFKFGGIIEGCYKAFDVTTDSGHGSWITSITYDTETTCAYGGKLQGSPIRINGSHQSKANIFDDGNSHPYFETDSHTIINGIVWDMNTKSGDYTSAFPACKSNAGIQDKINRGNIVGNTYPLPTNFPPYINMGEEPYDLFSPLSDILPLIFHKMPYNQAADRNNDYSTVIMGAIGVLESAKIYNSDRSSSKELSESCDNWDYLTYPFGFNDTIVGRFLTTSYYETILKTDTDPEYTDVEIIWRINEMGLSMIGVGYLKMQTFWPTTITIEKYSDESTKVDEEIYTGNRNGETAYTLRTLTKKFSNGNYHHVRIICRYDFKNANYATSVVIPKIALLTRYNYNVITINGGEIANRLSLRNVECNVGGTVNGSKYIFNPLFALFRGVVSGTNPNSRITLIKFRRNIAYTVVFNCVLGGHFATSSSYITENFVISFLFNETVTCNSRFVRATGYKKADGTYQISIQRTDVSSEKRNASCQNDVRIESIDTATRLSFYPTENITDYTALTSINSCGLITQRPTLQSFDWGFKYFDTTLLKDIMWNGTAWVDATGTPV